MPTGPAFAEEELDAIQAALQKAKLDPELVDRVMAELTEPGVTLARQ